MRQIGGFMNFTLLKNGLNDLCNLNLISVKENTLLSEYASFRIGGPCDFIIHPKSTDALIALIQLMKEAQYPYLIFGNASNILFSDEGYRGAAIFTTEMKNYTVKENTIIADAGMSFTALAVQACKFGLSGLEFAYGIPGSVGGAIYMNAGAYGGSVSDNLISSTCYNPQKDQICTVNGSDQHDFDYRHSCYMENNCIILSGSFALSKADPAETEAKMKEHMHSRRTKQPLELPSAGSVFKRPDGFFAGKLIEDAGLKGFSVGGAMVSTKHAGFIVNHAGATASDVLSLIEHIQKTVYSQFGVHLEREIICINETGTNVAHV